VRLSLHTMPRLRATARQAMTLLLRGGATYRDCRLALFRDSGGAACPVRYGGSLPAAATLLRAPLISAPLFGSCCWRHRPHQTSCAVAPRGTGHALRLGRLPWTSYMLEHMVT